MDEKRNEKKPGNPWTRSLLIWLAVLFGLVLFVRAFDSGSAAQGDPLAYAQVVREVARDFESSSSRDLDTDTGREHRP